MTPTQLAGRARTLAQQPWGLWCVQAVRLTRIELRRNLFSWRATWIYCLAFIPAIIICIHALVDRHPALQMGEDTKPR